MTILKPLTKIYFGTQLQKLYDKERRAVKRMYDKKYKREVWGKYEYNTNELRRVLQGQ